MRLNNKEKIVLKILKDFSRDYNANSLSKEIGLSSMGTLKILKNLEREGLLKSKKVSNITFYSINFDNSYTKDYVLLSLKKEVEDFSPFVMKWIKDLRKVENAEIGILFGSVLTKEKKAKDIDVLFVLEKKDFSKLKEEINEMNKILDKKIHAVYQTREDFSKNLKLRDVVVLEIIKGVLVFGERDFIEILEEVK